MSRKTKIQPLGNRALVKPDEIEQTTAGGLVLPPSSKDEKRPETGTVLVLGEGQKNSKKITFDLKVGDRIYFKKYSPEEIEVDNDKYLLIDLEDVLAIIK
jgi:chaperonin GroES